MWIDTQGIADLPWNRVICETDPVNPGAIYRPQEGTGPKEGAGNVRGTQLVTYEARSTTPAT